MLYVTEQIPMIKYNYNKKNYTNLHEDQERTYKVTW